MNDFKIKIKQSNQFFSPKAYIDNNDLMNSEFVTNIYSLSRSTTKQIEYSVSKTTTEFSSRAMYNDQVMQAAGNRWKKLETYSAKLKNIHDN